MTRMSTFEATIAAAFVEREAVAVTQRYVRRLEGVESEMEARIVQSPASDAAEETRDRAMILLIEECRRIEVAYGAHMDGLRPLVAFRQKLARLSLRGVEQVDIPEEIALQILSCADDLPHLVATFLSDEADPLLKAQLLSLAPPDSRDEIRRAIGVE